ncbi:carbohydrate ABC transporter permease [Streptomyces boluensis]|uniref:ABC transporter permease subunit n=1 Tax=Streptomyces boluensis TaxID=1775135 RepID=A0A964UKH5_9ACTN|nr:carbohydrate ABC transporter permease [Streptomyces boluensis]NBE50711.1 ABC transporter permease subunit [Streptomyces boluensis]
MRLRNFRRAPLYLCLALVVAVADLPLLWIVLTALKPDAEIIAYPPSFWPGELTFDNFRTLFEISQFSAYLRNSLLVSVGATALTVLLGVCAAYALVRFRIPGLRWVGELSLFAYLVPPILVLVPVAQVVARFGLANNLGALVVLYTATLLPFALWTLRSYFHGLTVELEEAAMVDGCTRFGAFVRVVLPQAVPGVIATSVFTFNAAWSEYLFASTLLADPEKFTVSQGLSLLMDQTSVYSWGVLMAAALVIVTPVLVLFVLVQKFLVGGVGQGAVK